MGAYFAKLNNRASGNLFTRNRRRWGHENILYMQRTVLFGRISPRTEKQICIKMTFWSMTNMNDDEAEQKVMKAM